MATQDKKTGPKTGGRGKASRVGEPGQEEDLPLGGSSGTAGEQHGDAEARGAGEVPEPKDVGRTDLTGPGGPPGEGRGEEAEADLETEAMKAEVDIVENPWKDDPRKGANLTIARTRRTLEPLDSVLGTKERRAEPLSRRRRDQDWEKTTLQEKVRWKGI